MLSIKEVSEILGVGIHTVKEWADKGRIDFISKEGEYYFEKEAVDNFISKTGIKLVKPEDSQKLIEEFAKKYSEQHSVITSDEIEKLLKDKKSLK